MKIIFSKLEFHYSFLIMALGLVFTGHFSNLLAFTSLIIIHEVGHVIAAIIFKYKVEKVIIYPFGGVTKLDTFVNTNINKDLLVAISGVMFQCLFYLCVFIFYSNGYIREYIYNLFNMYHNSMLLFNLLPIIPLDGFKIINLFLSKFLNFNLSNKCSVYISLFVMIIFLLSNIYENNYSMVLVISVLLYNIYNFYYNIDFVYNRFLLERYLYDFDFKNKILINDINKLYKNKKHFFIKNNKIVTEKKILSYFFKK